MEEGPNPRRAGELIQLTRKGVVFTGTQRDLDSLREKYDRSHYVILPQLYEPTLLEEIMRRVDTAQFPPKDHGGVGLEFCMDDSVTESMMSFFPNNPTFLRLIERITGQPRLGEFIGRVYRLTSSDGHYDGWHDDCCDQRVVTMSVNLSRQEYAGGVLQMKLRASDEIIQEIHNTGFGDALFFRISNQLKHRVQEVKGEIPKTAFAGWFLEVEDFLANLHKRSKRSVRNLANDQPGWEVPVAHKHE
jgi:2-oxoglutarate-Fe(II)-dependent oxygenase superfamily protein